MTLNKQVNIYSLDTSAFYSDFERDLAYLASPLLRELSLIEKKLHKLRKMMKQEEGVTIRRISFLFMYEEKREQLENRILFLKTNSKIILDWYLSIERKDTRKLRIDKLTPMNVVSIFESSLTRTLNMKDYEKVYDDIFIIRAYYFSILKDIVVNGFYLNGEKYRFLTASAGQIRQKKGVFIKESLYNKYEKTIMCGLSMEEVNKRGGMNVNKFIAYMALVSSATDIWEDFDIDKSIVVDDFETQYNDWVDYIDYENYTIDRRKMDVTIPHTDGVGMMLKGTSMIRLPFVKGLMVETQYDTFIRKLKRNGKKWFKENGHDYESFGKVNDIYGKEWDILGDDIRYIFTKSQFKLWKFYDSWEQYKSYFKEYKCEACLSNGEEEEFHDAKLNYQMLQTLTDISNEEIVKMCYNTQKEIDEIALNKTTMLNSFGVEEGASEKYSTPMQKALSLYPELLRDPHCKETLKQNKGSLVKQAKSGKIRINGCYTFVSPDTYAFCEWLFLKIENPKGLLNNGEVYCDLFDNGIKLDCLRSPHLFLEHCIRRNVIDKEKKKWFTSHCIYTSNRDMISKILQFDVDGDKLLVISNENIIEIAERNIRKYNVVPLYYDMKKANPETLNMNSIYEGMTKAYTGGNIGEVSNNISKMWNSFKKDDKEYNKSILELIKLMCMENNFVIDYAKTLFKPERPEIIDKRMRGITSKGLPHFFKYAKDKEGDKVEEINTSTTNMLDSLIINTRFNWRLSNIGKLDYKVLMRNTNVRLDKKIIERYIELNRSKKVISKEERDKKRKVYYVDTYIRNELLKINEDIRYVTDVLVKYLYEEKNASNKNTLWNSFGHIIVENIVMNLPQNTKLCEVCGDRFEYNPKAKKETLYCKKCAERIHRQQKTLSEKKRRKLT